MSSLGPIEIQPGQTADAQPQTTVGPLAIERSVPPDMAPAPEADWSGSVGNMQAPPAAAPTEAPVAGPEADLAGIQQEAASLNARGQKAVREEKAGIAQNAEAAKGVEDQKAELAGQQAHAKGKAMEDFAKAQQDIITAQNMAKAEWDKRRAALDTANQAFMVELNDHIAKSHPTDIWGAAGMNPIMGAIGLALGQMGTFAGGTNSVMEVVKMRASVRAQQLMAEGQALDRKSSQLGRLANQAESLYGTQLSASEKLQAALLQDFNAQVDLVANKYASPTARLKAVELKNAINLKAVELNSKADARAYEYAHDKLKADTDSAKLLLAARGKNQLESTTEHMKMREQVRFAKAAVNSWFDLKNEAAKGLKSDEDAKAGYTQEMLHAAAQARGVSGSSVVKYTDKEAVGAGIRDYKGMVVNKLTGSKERFGAHISSPEAFNKYGRSIVSRVDDMERQGVISPEERHGIPTLQEFDRMNGFTGKEGLIAPGVLPDASWDQKTLENAPTE